jgi:Rod binding domain-containing protein
MKIESALPASGGTAVNAKQDDPGKVKDAATQFEALLFGQMMRSARESSSGGWGGESDDKAGDSMKEMAEQQLSQLLAAGSGLGLAKLVIQGISRKSNANS